MSDERKKHFGLSKELKAVFDAIGGGLSVQKLSGFGRPIKLGEPALPKQMEVPAERHPFRLKPPNVRPKMGGEKKWRL